MSEKTLEDRIVDLEAVYDAADLDGLQERVIDAAGDYWAEDINLAVAGLDFEFRDAIRGMYRQLERQEERP